MSITYCTSCGRLTNSATSNYILDTEMDGKTSKECGVVTSCYAAFVDGKWVKGCVYNILDVNTKNLMNRLIQEEGV